MTGYKYENGKITIIPDFEINEVSKKKYMLDKEPIWKDKIKEYHGLDTETPICKNGDMLVRLICTEKECISINEEEILTDNGKKEFFERLMKLLFSYPDKKFFSFNLQFEAEAILRLLTFKGYDYLKLIYESGFDKVEYNADLYFQYVPKKFLKFCKRQGKSYKCVSIYDIAQYYKGYSLNRAAKQYLKKEKIGRDYGKKIGEEYGFYDNNFNEIEKYCIMDSQLAKELSEYMENMIESVKLQRGSLSFKFPISPASIMQRYILKNYKYPNVKESAKMYPKTAIAEDYAFKSYNGGIFQTYKRGYITNPIYKYDINSAYPSIMNELPHWYNGRFEIVYTPLENDTKYGWYICDYDSEYIPFPRENDPFGFTYEINKDGKIYIADYLLNSISIYYVKGKREKSITKAEYEWLLKNNVSVKFRIGVEWIQKNEKYEKPFGWIEDIYNKRRELKESKDKNVSSGKGAMYVYKLMLNSPYGKTAQHKKGGAKMSNFCYASYITALTRLKVLDKVIKDKESVIEVATDSITFNKNVDSLFDGELNSNLGGWDKEEYIEGLFLGNGINQLWEKGNKYITHARGITDMRGWDLRQEIVNNRDSDVIKYTRRRPVHLGEVISFNKVFSISDLGNFFPFTRRLKVNCDQKRVWDKEFKTFGEFYNSEPINSKPLTITQLYKNWYAREERKKEIAYLKEQIENRKAARKFQKTDNYEQDKLLIEEEKLEDSLREMRRWME